MISFFQKTLQKMAKHLSLWHEAAHFQRLYSIAQGRLIFVGISFLFAFSLIIFRLFDAMVCEPRLARQAIFPMFDLLPRANIVDRNGCVLATHLVTASVYADARIVPDPGLAAQQLHSVFPSLSIESLQKKLSSQKQFIWVMRHVSPAKQEAVQRLGIPGIYLKKDYKRFYPYSSLACHVIGLCDIDGQGISGIEKQFNNFLNQNNQPLRLSLDVRLQYILQQLLIQSIEEFQAEGGNAIIMKVRTGEIMAMESYPFMDLNCPKNGDQESLFNRNTLGVNEPGSVLKILNIAIALESGQAHLNSLFDATEPIHIGKFTVTDFRGKNRVLNLREAFLYSSNIAAVKILQKFGGAVTQKKFFDNFGLFEPVKVELPEVGKPLYPAKWTNATAMSSSYGYGIALTPLKLLTLINGIINEGYLQEPTLLCKTSEQAYQISPFSRKIVSQKTSRTVLALMRDVVQNGTGRKADVKGYRVFAKTGTAYKNQKGSYLAQGKHRPRVTTIVCGFPYEDPQYLLIFMLDDPKATKMTYGYATAGWNVTPYAAKVIERIAPLLGVPVKSDEDEPAELKKAPLLQNTGNIERHQKIDRVGEAQSHSSSAIVVRY